MQRTVSTSTTESGYLALLYNAKDAVCIAGSLKQVVYTDKIECLKFYSENKAAIALTKNQNFHAKTKHIDVAAHNSRELVDDRRINVDYINTNLHFADCLTKCLGRQQYFNLYKLMGIEDLHEKKPDKTIKNYISNLDFSSCKLGV